VIFVSAGHYPRVPGVWWRGIREHDECVPWMGALARLLPNSVIVPTGPLQDKIAWVNARARFEDIVVEVHLNAAPSGQPRGSETLHFPGSIRGKHLAELIQSRLAYAFSPNRGAKPGYVQGDPDRGILALLKRTRCTSVIVEPEFIYWPEHYRGSREAGCAAIAGALRDFYDG
jgi:hypothetical protein